MEINKLGMGFFLLHFQFVVGNGWRVNFWSNTWCAEVPLREMVGRIFHFAINEKAWVLNCWVCQNQGICTWIPAFTRHHDWDLDDVCLLPENLDETKLDSYMGGTICWKLMRGGVLSVKSLYNKLIERERGIFPDGWKWRISPGVGFFVLGGVDVRENSNPR